MMRKGNQMTNIHFVKDEEVLSLDAILNHIEAKCSEDRGSKVTLTFKPGRKYIKIVDNSHGSASVYCFLDFDGNIFKAASWKAPAKHIRGSVFDDDYSWGKGFATYGAAYL
jgi:N-acetyl-anhydromuramyl-L-alanine amidase AmpD